MIQDIEPRHADPPPSPTRRRASARHGAPSAIRVACALLAVAWQSGCVLTPTLEEESALRVSPNPFIVAIADPDASLAEAPTADDADARGDASFCLDELSNGSPIEDDDPRISNFAALLDEELRAMGFGTVSPTETNDTWDRVMAASGTLYDPITGRPDLEAHERARRAAMLALDEEHGCGFLLIPSIISVSTSWKNGIARWDGITERFGTGGAGAFGATGALSLHVSIWDGEWEQVYFGTGGIELLARVVDSFWESDFENVPRESLLTNSEWNLDAIREALRDLRTPVDPPNDDS